jgi:DOMON domain/Electron transfer DM13
LDPIRGYKEQTITLELPGDKTVFDIDWLSIFDLETNENFGSILIADGLNVPPSLTKLVTHRLALPNCRQLHKNLQLSWEVFGPAITMQLSGQIAPDDFMAFGLSGSDTKSQMLNADVALTYIDGHLGQAVDYHIDALAPCVRVLEQHKGVCRDSVVGGQDNFQLHTFMREDGINKITFRRSLISCELRRGNSAFEF